MHRKPSLFALALLSWAPLSRFEAYGSGRTYDLQREVSDWSIVIISTLPNSLTRSRGEYLRVVGIHSDG